MLQPQHIPIVFQNGTEQKLDSAVLGARVISLVNAVFDDASTVRVREGLELLDMTPTAGSAFSSVYRLASNKDELLLETNQGLYRYLPTQNNTVQVPQRAQAPRSNFAESRFRRAGQLVTPVSGTIERWGGTYPTRVGGFDCARGNGVAVYAWEQPTVNSGGASTLGIGIIAYDETTGAVLAQTVLNSTTRGFRSSPRVVYAPGTQRFFVYFASAASGGGTTMYVDRTYLQPSDDYSTFVAEAQVFISGVGGAVGTAGNEAVFDVVCTSDTNIEMVILEHSTPNLVFGSYSTTTGLLLGGVSQAIGTRCGCISLVVTRTAGGTVRVDAFYGKGANALYGISYNPATYTMASAEATLVAEAAGSVIGRITALDENYGTGSTHSVVYEFCNGTVYTSTPGVLNKAKVLTVTKSVSGLSTTSVLQGSWNLHGNAVSYQGRIWVPLVGLDPEGSTVVLADVSAASGSSNYDPVVVARAGYQETAYAFNEWTVFQRMPQTLLSNATITFPFQQWVADLQVAGGDIVTPTVVQRCDVKFDDVLGQSEVNGLTLLAGGCPSIYDGASVFEAGYHNRPYLVSVTDVGAGSDVPGAGTYYFAVCEQFQDERGNLHLGPPSNIKSVTTGAANRDLTFVVVQPNTRKSNSQLVYFRTAVNSTGPFYRMFDKTGVGVSDAVLAPTAAYSLTPDTLYTTGAGGEELPNDPCPPHRQSCMWDGRVWLAGCDDGYSIYFSKQVVEAFAPEFSVLFVRRVPQTWGRVTSVQPLGDRLLVLCERKIGMLFGSGPTVTGEQDGYSQVKPVVENLGAVWHAPLSSVVTPEGVWFQSQFGFRCVGQDGQVIRTQQHELGAEMDFAFEGAGDVAFAACVQSDKQQVRWVAPGSGSAVVWDYQWRQFSTFTNHNGIGRAAGSSFYIYGTSDTALYRDQAAGLDEDTDANNNIVQAVLETGQVALAGWLGLQRIKRLLLRGKSTAAVTQSVAIAAYYDESSESSLTSSAAVAPVASGTFEVEHHFARQKCESFRLKVTWAPTGTSGDRPRLTGAQLQAGVKGGHNKVPSSKRI